MKNKTPLLYFDIETFASWDKPSLDDIEAPSNYKDPQAIAKYKYAHLDKAWRKQALNSLKGQIIAIGYAFDDDDVEVLYSEDEELLLKEFDNIVAESPYSILVGHNILRFDIPFLFHRSLKYRLSNLKVILPSDKNDKSMVRDTLHIFSSTNYGSDSWYSLDDLAKFFGLESKNSKGDEIHDFFVNKEFDKITEHCKQDVELTRTIYKLTEIKSE